VVKLLLNKESINPDFRDNNGQTPLLYAIGIRSKKVVKLLLNKEGVNPDS
jgi:ankyrin repeat protein